MAPSQLQLKRVPKLELRVMKSDYCEFVLSDTDVSVANVLRRVIISHVPTIAVRSDLASPRATRLSQHGPAPGGRVLQP